jgi:hypothetical protein
LKGCLLDFDPAPIAHALHAEFALSSHFPAREGPR